MNLKAHEKKIHTKTTCKKVKKKKMLNKKSNQERSMDKKRERGKSGSAMSYKAFITNAHYAVKIEGNGN